MAKANKNSKVTDAQWRRFNRIKDRLIKRAIRMQFDLGTAGLFRTMHKMDAVTKQLGWEAADVLTGKQALMLSPGPGRWPRRRT